MPSVFYFKEQKMSLDKVYYVLYSIIQREVCYGYST